MAKRKPTVSTKVMERTEIIDPVAIALEAMEIAESSCTRFGDQPPEMTAKEFVWGFLLQAAGFTAEDVGKLLYFVIHAETAKLPERSPKKRKRRRK